MSFFDLHIYPTIKPFGQVCKFLLNKLERITATSLIDFFLIEKYPKLHQSIINVKYKETLWDEKRHERFLNENFVEKAFVNYSKAIKPMLPKEIIKLNVGNYT